MACEEFENQIADYVENQLPPADRSRITTHLAGCADCRAFAQQLEQLDAKLARALKAPVLPESFKTSLQRRIQTTAVLSEAQRAERKRQLQAEYEADLARLNRFPLPPRKLLEGLGSAGLIVLAGWLAWLFLPRLANLLAGPALGGINPSLLFSLVASAIFVAIGLAAAFPRQVKKRFGLPGMLSR
jgi:anti-sigma factor RsiW